MNSIRCRQCKHYNEANAGEGKIYGCDRSKCVFEPITKNSPEIDMAIKIIKADDLAPYSIDDILKARDLAVEALKQMTTTKNSLSAEEVTALAEWTEKLTKASEEAYNKGFADGANEVLDKIRAEIKSLERFEIRGEVTPLVNVDRVLEIIDKAESEAEDDSN